MKKFIWLIALIALCLILPACGETSKEAPDVDSEEIVYESDAEQAPEEEETEEINYDDLPEPKMINVDFQVTTNPEGSFVIETNLPSETELMLTLKGRGYLAQGKAYVYDGKAESERFTNKGEQLVGDFTLEVLMPIPSVQSDYVKHFIGKDGQYLTGPYVESALTSVVVSKEFKVSFYPPDSTSEATASTSASASNSQPDGKYYSTPTGKRYHLDPDCGGENSRVTENISGLTPCEKCAQ